jgi:transcriptional regulator with XRE-family HTH domain
MKFHKRLLRLRQERGLTWYRLAQLSGLTKQALSALELPTGNPTLDTLRKLSKALGVPIEELVQENEPPATKGRKGRRKQP